MLREPLPSLGFTMYVVKLLLKLEGKILSAKLKSALVKCS
jgi:hypothetical protein